MKNSSLMASSVIVLLGSIVLAGCGGKEGGSGTAESPSNVQEQTQTADKPVRLTLLASEAYLYNDDFQLLLVEPLKKKYPHITVDLIRPGTGTQIQDLIAAKTVPDLMILSRASKDLYKELGLTTDILPLLKKHQIDLSRFRPGVVEGFSDNGQVYGLPYATNTNALYYNEELFDKFGVSYPKDGLYWDDVLSLARKMTRMEGGVQYKGYDYFMNYWLGYQMSLPFIDKTTGKAAISTEGWKQVFQLMKSFDDIPGNQKSPSYAKAFTDDRTLAMVGTINLFPLLKQASSQGFRWNLAEFPSNREKPHVAPPVDLHELMVSRTSEHKEEAVRVIEVMTSEDVQLISARKTGRASALDNRQIEEQLGADIPYLQGKNIAAVFKSKPAPVRDETKADDQIKRIIDKNFAQVRSDTIDINTFMRQSEEEANNWIAAEKMK
ncbi:ABC transporter substrate-binding protein [Paenibacillus ginsengarvi]|uniref:Extracellular solute-binding protein n=1 Tax=Paenibacillus ginsengarvi TaxID=400777 RepID=A0A3B0BUV2_9BACL|nr:extracellular solute-binding protein [Paenibacillus ginsengarvi]RKN76019.1 extracellular solute-binding protein [Paenibacillus ginsengarvi]